MGDTIINVTIESMVFNIDRPEIYLGCKVKNTSVQISGEPGAEMFRNLPGGSTSKGISGGRKLINPFLKFLPDSTEE